MKAVRQNQVAQRGGATIEVQNPPLVICSLAQGWRRDGSIVAAVETEEPDDTAEKIADTAVHCTCDGGSGIIGTGPLPPRRPRRGQACAAGDG